MPDRWVKEHKPSQITSEVVHKKKHRYRKGEQMVSVFFALLGLAPFVRSFLVRQVGRPYS